VVIGDNLLHMDRRHFLRLSGLAASALALPDRLIADPYAPLPRLTLRQAPIRVSGRVHVDGRGVSGVRVSDGISVTRTRADGRYTLLADPLQPFVWVSTPAGHAPSRNAAGTALFYASLNIADEQQVDFALSRTADDTSHAMLLLADPQTKTRDETDLLHAHTVPAVLETLQTLGDTPVFGLTCGDIMYDDLTLYPEYERAVTRMGIPFYQLIGNHDLEFAARTTEDAAATFNAYFGPTWYSFDRGEVHYVVLDDVFWHGEGYLGYLSDRQLAWLAADLLTVEPGAPVVVLLHIPAISGFSRRIGQGTTSPANSLMNRDALYRQLEPFEAYILSGHTHDLEHLRDGGARHVVNGAVCGAWWSGEICQDGAPAGYMLYEMNGSALQWRYQSTGKPADHQMRVYARGADLTAPDEVAANIWAWDASWTVSWFEDGTPRGLMARRESRDPRAIELYAGPEKPRVNTWIEAIPTGHMFYATPSPDAREIAVEARDGWGRVYRETRRLG